MNGSLSVLVKESVHTSRAIREQVHWWATDQVTHGIMSPIAGEMNGHLDDVFEAVIDAIFDAVNGVTK